MNTSITLRRYWYFTSAYIYMELAAIPRRVRFDTTISTATTDHISLLSRFWKMQLAATFLYTPVRHSVKMFLRTLVRDVADSLEYRYSSSRIISFRGVRATARGSRLGLFGCISARFLRTFSRLEILALWRSSPCAVATAVNLVASHQSRLSSLA